MRIMIAGGGTGGHTSPATAILEELQKRDPRLAVQWVGCQGAIEERVSVSLAVPFRALPVEGWPRRHTPRKLVATAKMAWSAVRSWLYIRKFNPQVVIGVGGYVSLPLLWVAQRCGIPTVIHEQNRLLGVANGILAERATRLFLSFPETKGRYPKDRARFVGNPVRTAFANPQDKSKACEAFGLNPEIPVILVSGGSQGAHTINTAMMETVKRFEPGEAQFLWMTGRADAKQAQAASDEVSATVLVFPFIEDMATACAAADLVVSRAGASTTAEIAVMHKPSILVPYPHATDNHQEHNARAFAEAGAAVILPDPECTGESLARVVRDLLADGKRLKQMASAAATLGKPTAAETIAEDILALVFDEETTSPAS